VTIKILAQGGVDTKDMDDPSGLRLMVQQHGVSGKKTRRDLARAKYNVIAYFGDQLGDFSDEFSANHGNTAESRRDLVYKYQNLWGSRWFVLPNPVYGQYQQVLKGDATQYLRRAEK
jgi:predicted secreted acid phosphatase